MDRDIFCSQVWDVSGLAGTVLVRARGEDECGNFEEWETFSINFDVIAPMAKVYVWEDGVHVDELEACANWTEPQIGDELERYTMLTLGACADEVAADAFSANWFIKRATDHPLDFDSWSYVAQDLTGPFSADTVGLWDGNTDVVRPEPEVGMYYDIAVLTSDQAGNYLTWVQFLNYGAGTTWEEKWASLIEQGYVKRFLVVDHIAPVAHSIVVTTDCTPDSSVIFIHGNAGLEAIVEDPDVVAVTWAFLEVGSEGPWTVIQRVEGDSLDDFTPIYGNWNTELLNGTYWIGAFAEDYYGNMDGDLSAGEAGAPTNPLMVNVDNQAPTASIVAVWRTDDPEQAPVTVLERGTEHTFSMEASDNFTVRKVRFYYRQSNGDPDAWTQVGGDRTWPFSFNWTIPTDFVVGWTYDFIAVAVDYCEQTDYMNAQGEYLVDWTAQVVDVEANINIVTIGGQNAETTPHVNGDVCIVANSEPMLDYVRFVFIDAEGVEHEIRTVQGAIGQTTWTNCVGSGSYWDVTVLPEGPGQLCAIGSADLGGELVTMATDCRNIVIDHSLPFHW